MDNDTRASAVIVEPAAGPRRGIGLDEFRLADGFWERMQRSNSRNTLRHCLDWMDRLGWTANFDRVSEGATEDSRPGWQFSDSEIYKLLEALAWEYGRTGEAWVNALLESLVDRVAAAQDGDGYLNTCFGHAGQQPRYSDLASGHELYCTGHLLQAAAARARTVGPDKLVEVARRAADQVCRQFGPDGRAGLCGHPEIELGLAELGRVLHEPRYTEQARLFVERRGYGTLKAIPLLDASYFQDDVPVRAAAVWRGHAVRALYLAAGAADVAADTGDTGLLEAVERQWERTVERRTYLTGGMGSRHQDEGFGEDWELPPDRAYSETCAGIASVMVAWRLYLSTGEVRYADLMERTLYNVVAASPSPDGRSFFYANPLHQRTAAAGIRPDQVNPRAEGGVRAPWFDVSCCPTNLARTLAAWQGYAASVEGDTVTLLQYAAGELRPALDGGGELVLRITTEYPHDGAVRVEVVAAPDREVELRLRIPDWAHGATLADHAGERGVAPGWAHVRGVLVPGAIVDLHLPMEPRLTWPDVRIDAVRGCVAVERGPLVLCAESLDLPVSWSLDTVRIDAAHPPRAEGDGAVAWMTPVETPPNPAGAAGYPPYRSSAAPSREDSASAWRDVPLVPYYRWARRGSSAMRVFLPAAPNGSPATTGR
ncbi:glycoside hydrolase family 127 protein [Streptomonospora litoralis]|uniref:Non-reducing end beta-L-arabinofuranosidase n=1 Tax=Streptomonospora litoralis TaxID=2498135 RepID=A0A4P6Q4W7_9ACTN|nr:beta-L-arabinofuranosidase domain-containing protein [Streptomonospora litoralis]QBI55643.1 Non-reducing end beta-L-arabinofuranosidase [Streptomonospora litoralis]